MPSITAVSTHRTTSYADFLEKIEKAYFDQLNHDTIEQIDYDDLPGAKSQAKADKLGENLDEGGEVLELHRFKAEGHTWYAIAIYNEGGVGAFVYSQNDKFVGRVFQAGS